MAAVQHVYQGEGDPNGVITDAAVGSHYLDSVTGEMWQVAGIFGGESAWVLQRSGDVYLSGDPADTRTFYADTITSSIVPSNNPTLLRFEGLPHPIYCNVELQMGPDAFEYQIATDSLVEIRRIRGSGRLITITPVSQPDMPI